VEHLVWVIKKSMTEVIPFLLLFTVLFMGFGLAFYSLFGTQVYEVFSPSKSAAHRDKTREWNVSKQKWNLS